MKALFAAALVLSAWSTAVAGESRTDFVVGPLLSIQPVGYHDALPYLDNGISGTEPGAFATVRHRTDRNFVLTLDLSATRKMSVSQSGRLVVSQSGAPCGPFSGSGCGPALARHSDTLISALMGKRFLWGRGGFEIVAGPSLVLGNPKQNEFPIEDSAGRVALTVGIEMGIPLSERVDLAPTARYSRVLRGENDFYVGLGANIFRVGIGLRVRLSGR